MAARVSQSRRQNTWDQLLLAVAAGMPPGMRVLLGFALTRTHATRRAVGREITVASLRHSNYRHKVKHMPEPKMAAACAPSQARQSGTPNVSGE
jgi:hypothetical protein